MDKPRMSDGPVTLAHVAQRAGVSQMTASRALNGRSGVSAKTRHEVVRIATQIGYRVNVAARIWWANDNVDPDEVSPPFNLEAFKDEYFDHFYPGRRLKYELWLDAPAEFDAAPASRRDGTPRRASRAKASSRR